MRGLFLALLCLLAATALPLSPLDGDGGPGDAQSATRAVQRSPLGTAAEGDAAAATSTVAQHSATLAASAAAERAGGGFLVVDCGACQSPHAAPLFCKTCNASQAAHHHPRERQYPNDLHLARPGGVILVVGSAPPAPRREGRPWVSASEGCPGHVADLVDRVRGVGELIEERLSIRFGWEVRVEVGDDASRDAGLSGEGGASAVVYASESKVVISTQLAAEAHIISSSEAGRALLDTLFTTLKASIQAPSFNSSASSTPQEASSKQQWGVAQLSLLEAQARVRLSSVMRLLLSGMQSETRASAATSKASALTIVSAVNSQLTERETQTGTSSNPAESSLSISTPPSIGVLPAPLGKLPLKCLACIVSMATLVPIAVNAALQGMTVEYCKVAQVSPEDCDKLRMFMLSFGVCVMPFEVIPVAAVCTTGKDHHCIEDFK